MELETAVKAWGAALGEERCLRDSATLARYARSTQGAGFAPACVLYPQSSAEVQSIVQMAGACNIPLYPISRGCNWGYGDATPLEAGCAVVDLSRMNRILEINRKLAYAVIEPGVSQAELYAALQAEAPDLWMDSTGAGLNASIVGNVLERGFGHTPYGDHSRSTSVLEVVAGNGALIAPGFARFPGARAAEVFPQGVGPSLKELFPQSNFGIVTRMVLWLYPRPEAFRCFYLLAPEDEALFPLLEALRPLRLSGVLNSALHIGNDLRMLSSEQGYPWERAGGQTPLPRALRLALRRELGAGAWNVSGSFSGTKAFVRGAARAVRRQLKSFGPVVLVDDRKLALARMVSAAARPLGLAEAFRRRIEMLGPNYGLVKGIPTNAPVRGVYWRMRELPEPLPDNPLETRCGLYWLSPVLPITGEDARRLLEVLVPILHAHGFDDLLTFTLLNERAMVAVANISYDQSVPGEAESAAACYDAAMAGLMASGYVPYRLGPRSMQWVREASETVELLQRIKGAFDPAGVIAPGRYVPE